MWPDMPRWLLCSALLAPGLGSPLLSWRRQHVGLQPAIYVGSVNRSGSDLNSDTWPLPQVNSTNLPVALKKALHLNLTDELSRFYPNGSYANTFELPDINNKNYSDPHRCYWPQIGQRYQVQAFESFVSKTSMSRVSFWVNDESNGRYIKCVNDVPPGWNLLQTYVLIPCLSVAVAWELQGGNADILMIRSFYICKE